MPSCFPLSAAVAWTRFAFLEEIGPQGVRTGPCRSLLPLSPLAGEEGWRDWEEPVLRVTCAGSLAQERTPAQERGSRSCFLCGPPPPHLLLSGSSAPRAQVRRPLRTDFHVLGTSVLGGAEGGVGLSASLFFQDVAGWTGHQREAGRPPHG